MNLSVGIVGLPNVGKSTLFNALLKKQQALVANYPFATIEPNIGIVPVPDTRLQRLAEVVSAEGLKPGLLAENLKLPPIVPATVKFVDIAGLVKGANEGAGLGNKFLSHIREVSLIAHVVRVFEDSDIVREGSTDPVVDYGVIETEMILSDLSSISNIKNKLGRGGTEIERQTIDKIYANLDKGIPIRNLQFSPEEQAVLNQFFLLSAKKEVVVLNVSEGEYVEQKMLELRKLYSSRLSVSPESIVIVCAKIEQELAELNEMESKEYLNGLGVKQSGLEQLVEKAYQTLGLISFLTAGEKEVRAWTIRKGSTAVEAAGEIHTDFMKKFIKAEVISFDDFAVIGGWKKAREHGATRLEGRDYVMKDGDVVEFKIGS